MPGPLGLGFLLQASADSIPSSAVQIVQHLKSVPVIGGVSALLVLILVGWVIKDPLEASKQFWRLMSFFFGYFGRRYSKAAVEKDANAFFSRKLLPGTGEMPVPRLMVNFVDSANDARLREDGHIVVRMRSERDQSRNVLAAVRTAIQHLLYPHARAYLHKPLVSAVDLEVLQLLANLLGARAQVMYSTEILTPRTESDPQIPKFLSVIQDIEKGGLFGSVLIQELAGLSDRLKASHPTAAVADEAVELINWLESIATRPPGDETGSLIFIRNEFRLAFILAAKAVTAAKGVGPYQRRLGIDLLQGARNIYVLGLTAAHTHVCDAIGQAFDSDPRVKRVRTSTVTVRRDGRDQRLTLIQFRRNELYMSDASFSAQLADCGIEVGQEVSAQIRGLVGLASDMIISNLDATLQPSGCAWGYRGSTARFVRVGETVAVVVSHVDDNQKTIHVVLKSRAESNWSNATLPRRGSRVRGVIEEFSGGAYIVRLTEMTPMDTRDQGASVVRSNLAPVTEPLFGRILATEWSWYNPEDPSYVDATIGQTVEAEVVVVEVNREDLLLSRRNLEVRDWSTAKKRYPKGTSARARVLSVTGEGLVFELEAGVFGRIPNYKVRAQGYELSDYQKTVIPGSQYDVVVTGTKESRKDFRLEFARRPTDPSQ